MSEYSHNPLKTADSPNHGNHLNGLTTRQDRAIAALLESPSIAAAARKAEVGESTLRQWLREDEDFQAMLRLTRHETLSHVTTRLQQEAEKAVDAASTIGPTLAYARLPGRRSGIQDDLGQIRLLGVEAVEHLGSAFQGNSRADDRLHADLASSHEV